MNLFKFIYLNSHLFVYEAVFSSFGFFSILFFPLHEPL